MATVTDHLPNININDEWETPQLILDDVCKKYKVNPILDVCCTAQNKKCKIGITKLSDTNNGLTIPWNMDFFMNPPYSEIDLWMKKAYYDHLNYNVNGIILTYNKTDTKWWHSYVEDRAEIHFIKGRLKFEINGIVPRWCKECKQTFIENIDFCPICNNRLKKNTAPYPNCWIIYRKKKL